MDRQLEIEQDLAYQCRVWKVQRVGWVILLATLIGALLGIFGHGPLARAVASDPTGHLQIEYDRFVHYDTSSYLTISIVEIPQTDGTFHLHFDDRYTNDVRIENLIPMPVQVALEQDSSDYVFQIGTGNAFVVTVHGLVQTIGRISGRIRVDGIGGVSLNQLAYP